MEIDFWLDIPVALEPLRRQSDFFESAHQTESMMKNLPMMMKTFEQNFQRRLRLSKTAFGKDGPCNDWIGLLGKQIE